MDDDHLKDSKEDAETEGSLYAGSSPEFFETFVVPHYGSPPHANFCSDWQKHPQAILIIEGLWRSYEEARASDLVNAGGQSTCNFLVGHFFPLMDILTSPDGDLALCRTGSCAAGLNLEDRELRRVLIGATDRLEEKRLLVVDVAERARLGSLVQEALLSEASVNLLAILLRELEDEGDSNV